MFELLLTMLERLGIIVTIAFVLTRFRFFRDMIHSDQLARKQQYVAIGFFGFFGIIGTYTGLTFSTESLQFNSWPLEVSSDEAIANSRVIGVVLAGLLGGKRVGFGAGLIAGFHRYMLGGFTALACGLASIIAGLIAGSLHKRNRHMKLRSAFVIGAGAETVQMLIILLLSNPFENAIALVEVIGIPMILANGIGCALFLLIIKNVVNEEEKAGALQAQKTLRIADQTLGYLRQGLSAASAKEVCQILHREIDGSAVAMTNRTHILSHVGLANNHHQAGHEIQTTITKNVINDGEIVIANDQTIHCSEKDCPLGAAIIAPLKQRGKTIGTLKFYFRSEKEITHIITELVLGLSNLLSNQLEIAEADKAYQLAKEAEIKALQAQISPHFLFNSLNTIISLIRIEPDKARKLLVSLSHFLRQNLSGTTMNMTSLNQELKHVKAYLEIEEARFVDRLKVIYDIDESALTMNLPPLTLQPIVENAIKHGIKNKNTDCLVEIRIARQSNGTLVCVTDNGEGIPPERLSQLGQMHVSSELGTGLGLYNVNRRLSMLYSNKATLHIRSTLHEGTTICFMIPTTEDD
ncbi:sensor histidine kinase [Guptibacillus hwajinpoensis]|uniref:histidine kinase n=1 Tax=Guptibacillus hwajinpoensis TaxID=208199 RepID=A0ABU0K9A4_9BACL|nr:sensor histidine kinase [Alkalihalobacillus hemicentroti]MDQ0484899.1 two-component system sensor histidine kinase LytS [Alkalihalobacillus hemicentroti]